MTPETTAPPAGRRLTSLPGLELAIPECPRGIGSTISSPSSKDLIDGVVLSPFSIFPDDRGYFLEVHRMGAGPAALFLLEARHVRALLLGAEVPNAIQQQEDSSMIVRIAQAVTRSE